MRKINLIKSISKTITLLLCLYFHAINTKAQVTKVWDKSYGTSGYDYIYSQSKTTDGGIIMCGFNGKSFTFYGDETNDIYVVKIKSDGTKEWEKTFSGTKGESANSIIQTSDGGYILCGETGSNDGVITDGNNGGRRDVLVLKLKPDGSKEWDKTFGGSDTDIAYSIIETIDKGFILCGFTLSNDIDISTGNKGSSDLWVLKLSQNGVKVWDKTLGGVYAESGNSIIQNIDGTYVISGRAQSTNGDVTGLINTAGEIWVVKLNEKGNLIWNKTLKNSSSPLASIYETTNMIATTDKGFIICGASFFTIGNQNSSDLLVIKIDELGNRVWEKAFGGSESEVGWNIIQTLDGGYMVSGHTFSIDGDVTDGNNGSSDIWILKINSNGVKLWDKTFGGTIGEGVKSYISQISKTEYIVSTSDLLNSIDIQSIGNGGFDIVSIKFEDGPPCSHIAKIEAPNGKEICSGGNVSLIAKADGTTGPYYFFWKQGINITHFRDTVNINKAGKYILNVVDKNSCTAFAEIEITQTNLSTFTSIITGTNNFCTGQNTTLTANVTGGASPYSYQWKNNTTNVGTNANTLTVSVSGAYNVSVTDSKGCTGVSTNYTVTQNPLPNVTMTKRGNTDLLTGGSVVLSVPSVANQTYQWFKDNNAIAGAVSNSYTANSAGKFSVIVNANSCSATSEIVTVNIILVNEIPNESKNFKTFPNPFESVIKVNFNEPLTKLAKLHLFNSIGTMVKEWTTNQQENSFDILELPNGVYILKCEINGKIEAVKLVKN